MDVVVTDVLNALGEMQQSIANGSCLGFARKQDLRRAEETIVSLETKLAAAERERDAIIERAAKFIGSDYRNLDTAKVAFDWADRRLEELKELREQSNRQAKVIEEAKKTLDRLANRDWARSPARDCLARIAEIEKGGGA